MPEVIFEQGFNGGGASLMQTLGLLVPPQLDFVLINMAENNRNNISGQLLSQLNQSNHLYFDIRFVSNHTRE